jgi:predicted esterase
MRALLLAILLLGPAFGGTALPTGEVIPRVVCQAKPAFSYALYLPTGYRADRPWPVLFGFSPGGAGEEPVRLFQKAAERFGWIVVGSNDSRNGPLRPALEASEALWEDVHARFAVDPKRSYGAGFSGGARMALRLALKHPREFAGLISIGAFGTAEGMLTGLGHLDFHLSGGLEDFNHWELLRGRKELQRRGWRALADRFEGGHRWAPEALTEPMLGFLELGAMRRGLVARDPALEVEVRAGLERNAAQAGKTLLALRRWEERATLFPDAPEGHRAKEQTLVLAKEPAVLDELNLEERYGRAAQELAGMTNDVGYRERLAQIIDRLRESSPAEQRQLRRLLGGASAAYYVALSDAYERKSWAQVFALSTSLAALDEREGWPCIYAAAALAQLGKAQESLTHLKAAQLRGYRRPDRIRALEELKPLRGDLEFEAILKAMESTP